MPGQSARQTHFDQGTGIPGKPTRSNGRLDGQRPNRKDSAQVFVPFQGRASLCNANGRLS